MFVDRSAKHFEKILNFMRDGDVALPSSEEDRQEIMKEAQYYKLKGLKKLCQLEPTSRFLDGVESAVNAIENSKKKAVLHISYSPDSGFYGASKLASICDKYGEEFDIYFSRYPETSRKLAPSQWNYQIHDKSNDKFYSGQSGDLDASIKKHFGVKTIEKIST